jgi:hypothetical protein
MCVSSNDGGFRFVEFLEISNHSLEGLVSRLGFQIADVLADEDLRADREGDGVL